MVDRSGGRSLLDRISGKQKQKSVDEFDTQDSCAADSESEKVSELEDSRMTKSRSKGSKDGELDNTHCS